MPEVSFVGIDFLEGVGGSDTLELRFRIRDLEGDIGIDPDEKESTFP